MSLFIIAEIGINHNGDVGIAKQLIDVAKIAGANAVKFQKRTIDLVYSKEMLNSSRESPWGTTQRAQKERLEFGMDEYQEIDAYCKEKNIIWFASAWDEESQLFLRQYNLPYNKVASPMLTDEGLTDLIAEEGKHTFISTGMSTFEQIDRVVEKFDSKNCLYTLMHCVSTYPCSIEDCNINVIKTLKERYNCPVGYSGHETGLLPSLLAVAVGAVALERHITLDRAMYGSDQASSLGIRGQQLLFRDVRKVDDVLGNGAKRVLAIEKATEEKLRYFRNE